jgi:hypothetical protein
MDFLFHFQLFIGVIAQSHSAGVTTEKPVYPKARI